MKNKKYVMIGGFAFSERGDMKKLKRYAKKGWLLDGIKGMHYRLIKGEPKHLDFAVDYQNHVDADYFEIFEAAGWKHELSIDEIHIFSAPEGTKPIHTDQRTEIDKIELMKKTFKPRAIITTSILLFIIVADFLFLSLSGVWEAVWFAVFMISLIAAIFMVLPYIGFCYRSWQLKRKLT